MTGSGGYDPTIVDLCERMLVTVIGNAGFWGRRLYLVGGLVPRYLYGPSKTWASAPAGSPDLDLAVTLLVGDPAPELYEIMARNLVDAGFRQAPFTGDPDSRWRKEADGVSLVLEFICDTDEVQPGQDFSPRAGSGSSFRALNTRGARLVGLDCKLVLISAERLDGGASVNVGVQVVGLMPFMVLKTFAFVDRHHARDAYDIVWSLANHRDGPEGAGREMAASPVVADPLAVEAVALLRSRFGGAHKEAPMAYAAFLGVAGSLRSATRLRLEAVETVGAAIKAFNSARASARQL